MPPRKDKKGSNSTSATTEPALAPIESGDQPNSPTASSNNDIASLRHELRSMAVDLNSKLDTVISNQEGILTRIQTLETKQHEMEEAIQFSSTTIEEIQDKNKTMSDGVSDLTTQINTVMSKINQLEEATLQLERHSRGFNLRFGGIPENPTESTTFPYDTVKKILTERFNMPIAEIEAAHRTGRAPKSASDKPRHIIARFIYRNERHSVLSGAKSALTNTGMFILPDLPAPDVAKKRSLRDVMKRAYDAGHHPVFRNGELYIQGRKYSAPQAS